MRRRNVAFLILGLLPILPCLATGTPGFIENRGQVDNSVRFYTGGDQAAVYFTPRAVVIDLHGDRATAPGVSSAAPDRFPPELLPQPRAEAAGPAGCAVWMSFPGADAGATIEAREPLATRYNYFLGKNPAHWATRVPAYAEIVYRDLWPGINLVYRQDDRSVSYRFDIAPGADAGAIRVSYAGADRVTETSPGTFLIETPVGSFVDVRPAGGAASGSISAGAGASASADAAAPGPVIADNPAALLGSTYFGGGYDDRIMGLALDTAQNAVVTGWAYSPNFPATPGAYDPSQSGSSDVFVAKLDNAGTSLLWCSLLGGASEDIGYALALDNAGNPVITGTTLSTFFPTTHAAYDTTWNDFVDAFVTKLKSSGDSLLWSTFLGGHNMDRGFAIAVDASNAPIVGGDTEGPFPVPAGFDSTMCGLRDGFVAKFSAAGNALAWSTFVGGTAEDAVYGVAIDASGRPVVTGHTASPDSFPLLNALYPIIQGGTNDFFATRLSAAGALVSSTYLGGRGLDVGTGIAIDATGNVDIAGYTQSTITSFPISVGAPDQIARGTGEGFVMQLNSTLSAINWATYVGGSLEDRCMALALDPSGQPVVTGFTRSLGMGTPGDDAFPTTASAYSQSSNGGLVFGDAFVTQLNSTGTGFVWSSFLGGGDSDIGCAIAYDNAEHFILAGGTVSSNFPTTPGAFDLVWNGGEDSFLTRFDPAATALSTSVGGSAGAPGRPRAVAIPSPARGDVLLRIASAPAGPAMIRFYDTAGRLVRTVSERDALAGVRESRWDGRDDAGRPVGAGIYFYSMTIGAERFTGKLSIVR